MYKKLGLPIITALIALLVVLSIFKANTAGAQFNARIHPAGTFASLGTAFTYQGTLTDEGQPADGSYDFIFDLYDSETTGTGALVSSLSLEDQPVSNGLFTMMLDYGDIFDGTALWLEIRVRPGSSSDTYTTLEPRQALSATPYASYAAKAGSIPWTGISQVPVGFDDDLDNDTLAGLNCTDEQIPKWNGIAWECASDLTGGSSGWSLTGNAGTTAGTNFLGTTDDEPLELHVNGYRALLLEPDATSPNIIAGYNGNSAGASTVGAVIGGGGRDLATNQVGGNYGTIGGGAGNIAEGYASFVGGGEGNAANSSYTTIGGGILNQAGGDYVAIAGGRDNTTSANYAVIGGGGDNLVTATFATIAGGQNNDAFAGYSAVGGGLNNQVFGVYGTIAGGGSADLDNPTTSNNQVLDDYGTISGGGGNTAGSDDSDPDSAIFTTIGGGRENTVSETYGTVGGGYINLADGYSASVGGGYNNNATNNYAVVAGGTGNTASGANAAVAGGKSNTASQTSSGVGGGQNNTAGGAFSAIGGGYSNQITANYGTIPGGFQNFIGGNFGFAAGYQARAEHQGSFVWSDSQTDTFASTGPDQFLIDASGGVGIGTNTPSHMLTVAGDTAIRSSAVISVGAIVNYPGMIQTPGPLYAVGDLLYATGSATNTLSIWNMSDPTSQDLIGYTTFQLHSPSDLQVVGDRAYIASRQNNMLVILDVSNPTDISHVSDTNDSLERPVGVHISGKYAYVASEGRSEPPIKYDGLTLFDITDLPTELAATNFITTYLQGTSDVFVSGSYAYVTSRDNNRLVVFDVSDPDTIVPMGYTEEALIEPVRVHVSGLYAYVIGEGADSLVVFDVSDPAQITYEGQVMTGLIQPRSLYISGDRAYVAYAGDETSMDCGLAVLDISDPTNVAVVNALDMSDMLKWINIGSVIEPNWVQLPPKPAAVTGSGARIYLSDERHDEVFVFEIDSLEASALRADQIQGGNLEISNNAAIAGNLGVRGGLNVGPGGALIQGALTVESDENSIIGGRLGIGSPATVITSSISITETEWHNLYLPTHQLDVNGEARVRVNEHNHLVFRSRNTGSDEDAYIDFVKFDYTDLITPSARIEFDASDPFTHTTSMRFYTQGSDDSQMSSRLEITSLGDVRPGADGTYLLGIPGRRWEAVYSVNGTLQTSDGRYKENLNDLPYGLDEVAELRPVSFNWADGPDDEVHYGLVAQEVMGVLPEIVRIGDDPEGTLAMNYSELVPVLVRAVQEQQVEIDTQAEQIASLEARLNALEETQGGTILNTLGWIGGLGLVVGAVGFTRRKR